MRIIFTTLTVTISALTAHTSFAQEFTTEAAKEAKSTYEAGLEKLKEEYKQSLTKAAVKAAEEGDLDEVVRIKEAKEGLEGKAEGEDEESKRVLWKHKVGYFERLNDGHWIERVGNGDAHIFAQSSNTDEYIELSRVTGARVLVRIYDDYVELITRAETKRLKYRGEWTDRD